MTWSPDSPTDRVRRAEHNACMHASGAAYIASLLVQAATKRDRDDMRRLLTLVRNNLDDVERNLADVERELAGGAA